MIELEDIVPRRDYKLNIDWRCPECVEENQGGRVTIFGTTLPGEYAKDKKDITWDDLFHLKCLFGHISRPKRICSRCGNRVPYEAFSCPPCEERIIQILEYEEGMANLKESIKLAKRKKEPLEQLQQNVENLKLQLHSLGVKECPGCNVIWINISDSRCKECGE